MYLREFSRATELWGPGTDYYKRKKRREKRRKSAKRKKNPSSVRGVPYLDPGDTPDALDRAHAAVMETLQRLTTEDPNTARAEANNRALLDYTPEALALTYARLWRLNHSRVIGGRRVMPSPWTPTFSYVRHLYGTAVANQVDHMLPDLFTRKVKVGQHKLSLTTAEAHEIQKKEQERRVQRLSNPTEVPEIPATLTGTALDEATKTVLSSLNGMLSEIPDLKRRLANLNAMGAYQPEAYTLTFARLDRLSGDYSEAKRMKRARKFAQHLYGKQVADRVVEILPDLLNRKVQVGQHPLSIPTKLAESVQAGRAKLPPATRREPAPAGMPAEVKELAERAVAEANRALNAGRSMFPKKGSKRDWRLLWSVTKADPSVITARKPYQYMSRWNERRGYFGVAPSPMSIPERDGTFSTVDEDFVQVYLLNVPGTRKWTVFFRTFCLDADGGGRLRPYSLSFPVEAREAAREVDPKVSFDDDGNILFSDIERALDAFSSVLVSLGRLTYERACSADAAQPVSLEGGEIPVGFLLQDKVPGFVSERLSNPAWVLPAAAALVTAVGLGDSLYQLHAVLTR